MREVPFVRKADDLALATSHLAQSSSASRFTAGAAGFFSATGRAGRGRATRPHRTLKIHSGQDQSLRQTTRAIETECHIPGAMAPRPLFGVSFLMWLPRHFQARMPYGLFVPDNP
jgi:hypothetical protein